MDNPTDLNVPVVPTAGDNSVPTQLAPQSFVPRKEAGTVGQIKSMEPVGQPNWQNANEVASAEGDDYWKEFAKEIIAEKEAIDIGGMEKIEKGEAVISPELAREMGVKPVAVPEPVTDKSDFSVRGVSFSDDQISSGMKQPTGRGIRWLVEWFVLQLQRAHFHIKRSWGGVVERSL